MNVPTISQAAHIVRGVRRYLNLNQEDIAKITNISQSSISKIESGKLEFSALEWVLFCEHFQIHPNSLIKGYIWLDESKFTTSNSQIKRKANIKKEYQKEATVYINLLIPTIEFIRESLGEKDYQIFLKDLKIGKDFFCILNNRVNGKCITDILKWVDHHVHH